MAPPRTHYDTLQVPRDASLEAIQAAYRSLARKYHPDRSGNSAENEAAMQALNAAYAVLSHPLKRAEHDRWIEAEIGPESPAASPPDFERSTASDDLPSRGSAQPEVWRSVLGAVFALCYLAGTVALLYLPGFRLLGVLLVLAGWLRYRRTHPD